MRQSARVLAVASLIAEWASGAVTPGRSNDANHIVMGETGRQIDIALTEHLEAS